MQRIQVSNQDTDINVWLIREGGWQHGASLWPPCHRQVRGQGYSSISRGIYWCGRCLWESGGLCRWGFCRMGRGLGTRICSSRHLRHRGWGFRFGCRRILIRSSLVSWKRSCLVGRRTGLVEKFRRDPRGLLGSIPHRDRFHGHSRDFEPRDVYEPIRQFLTQLLLILLAISISKCQDFPATPSYKHLFPLLMALRSGMSSWHQWYHQDIVHQNPTDVSYSWSWWNLDPLSGDNELLLRCLLQQK